MPLDPSLIIQPRRVAALSPADAQANALKLSQMQMSIDDAKRADQERLTIADLYKRNTDASGNLNAAGVTRGLAESGLGDRIPEFQTKQADYGKAVAGMNQAQLEFHKKQLDAVNGSLASLLAKPDLNHDDVIGAISGLVDNGIIDNNAGAKMVQQLPGPDQLRGFLTQRAIEGLDQSKKIEMLLPKYDEQDRGGVINEGTINPLTGVRTPGKDIEKSATPGEKLTDKRLGAGENGGLSSAAIDLAARRLLNGEPASKVLANFGRGAQGAREIAAVQNRLAELASGSDIDATELALRTQELASEARTRTELGAREGKIAPRVQEALNFAQIAKQASAAVPRGNFLPWNKLSQMTDTQLNDPNLAKLKAATLSLINAYAAAVGGGTPTVHDKEEAAHVLSTAQSPEAYAAVVDQLITETQAALKSPGSVMEDLRKSTRERNDRRDNKTPASQPPLTNSKGWQLHTDASGNQAYVSPDGSQYEEVQ